MQIQKITPNRITHSFSYAGVKKSYPAYKFVLNPDKFTLGNFNKTRQEFIKLRDAFYKRMEIVCTKLNRAKWDFETAATSKNRKIYQKAEEEYKKFLLKNYYSLQNINSADLNEQEKIQLNNMLEYYHIDKNSTDTATENLGNLQNKIEQKINSYTPEIDGRKVSKVEIYNILQTETNPAIREKAYNAKLGASNLVANDLIKLIKMRNDYAKTKGYDNFYEYELKETYGMDVKLLDKLIDEIYSKVIAKDKDIENEEEQELKEFYKTDKLENYHYGLQLSNDTNSNAESEFDNFLKNVDIKEISKKMYRNMGYDIDKLVTEKKLVLDLEPREGKNSHALCAGITPGKDVRILANLNNSAICLDILNHELGHAMYFLGIDTKLPYPNRQHASISIDESIAFIMQDLIKKENVLKGVVPDELFTKIQNSHAEDEKDFVTSMLHIIEFERQFYKNPNQNPSKLWNDLTKKYYNREETPDNSWVVIPHYVSYPAYCPSYVIAKLMKEQIYNYLKSELGNFSENKNTAEFLKNKIFSYGNTINEYDLIKKLTGKELSADDFIESLNRTT